jgi:hypothetical protein
LPSASRDRSPVTLPSVSFSLPVRHELTHAMPAGARPAPAHRRGPAR